MHAPTIQKSKILVVEDEKDIQDLMMLHLRREGHDITGVEDGEQAFRLMERFSYDLVLLDWMLPSVSGLDLCKKIGRRIPVLMVTARADAADIVLGLEMGADDYLTKPFEISVFLARVRALLRRSQCVRQIEKTGKIQIGDLAIDLEAHQVFHLHPSTTPREILLTPSEFKLLSALMQNQGRVLSREKLIELVQGQGVVVVDRAIDTHVFGLRKKLGDCAAVIETIRGIGYRVTACN